MTEPAKFLALLGVVALLVLGVLFGEYALYSHLKPQVQYVTRVEKVVVTPTAEPTATPAAMLRRVVAPTVRAK